MTATTAGLRVLLLADSLPNPADPDPRYRFRNVFAYHPLRLLSERHRLEWPLLLPAAPGLLRLFCHLRGREPAFPAPLEGSLGGIAVHTLRYPHLPRLYPALKTRALVRHLERQGKDFDLVHCHSLYDLGLSALALKAKFGWPYLLSCYGSDVNWLFGEGGITASAEIARASREALRGADRVICVSGDLADKVCRLGVAPERVTVVPNGMDPQAFAPGDRSEARRGLGWPLERKVILYVGNIFRTKGLDELAEAAAQLARDGREDFLVVLAGPEGEYGPQLRERIAGLGLGERCLLLGAQPHERVPELMRACDIFCLPSWREGSPTVIPEALACGKPVVATRVGGIPELLSDPRLGLLVPPRDSSALAEALAAALERPWDSQALVQAAQQYSHRNLAARIEQVWRRVAGQAG